MYQLPLLSASSQAVACNDEDFNLHADSNARTSHLKIAVIDRQVRIAIVQPFPYSERLSILHSMWTVEPYKKIAIAKTFALQKISLHTTACMKGRSAGVEIALALLGETEIDSME